MQLNPLAILIPLAIHLVHYTHALPSTNQLHDHTTWPTPRATY